MKKTLLFLSIIAFCTISVFAQTARTGNLKCPDKSLPAYLTNQKLLSALQQHPHTRGSAEWFDYAFSWYVLNYPYNEVSTDYLFPDTNIVAIYGGGAQITVGAPDVHSLATILDPKSSIFDNPVSSNAPYKVDSVQFNFHYFRHLADNVVDTLLLNVFDNSPSKYHDVNLIGIYFTGLTAYNYNVDTVFVDVVPYNYLLHSPQPFVIGAVQVKVPLDKNFLNDTALGGVSTVQISTAALGTIDAGSLVVATASFIPGYRYSHSDTLNSKDYILFSSLDENGQFTYPYYANGDWNQSSIANDQVQYNFSPRNLGGFDSTYVPTVAFDSAYTLEDHDFGFLIDADFSTGTKSVANATQNMGLHPNPCASCYVSGVADINDLLVTDILGRTVAVSYTKTSGGYRLNLPDDRTGFFIVKNVKTGEVVKFIKE